MAAGGPRVAMERFLRWAAGDAAFASIDAADRDRYLDNGEVFLGAEMPPFLADQPAVEAIAYQAASWLAREVGADLVELSGSHTAYLTDPAAVADGLRPLLRALS